MVRQAHHDKHHNDFFYSVRASGESGKHKLDWCNGKGHSLQKLKRGPCAGEAGLVLAVLWCCPVCRAKACAAMKPFTL